MSLFMFSFFFQAEDGIRDFHVTGVQTCALPISGRRCHPEQPAGRQYPPYLGWGPVYAGLSSLKGVLRPKWRGYSSGSQPLPEAGCTALFAVAIMVGTGCPWVAHREAG